VPRLSKNIFKLLIHAKLMSHTLGFNVIPAPHLMRGIQPFHWFPVFTGTSLDSRFHGNDATFAPLSFLRKQACPALDAGNPGQAK